MYSNKLVVTIMVNGKHLHEKGEEVYIPYGSEYEIFLKNENSKNALVSIEVDGRDIINNQELIIAAGEKTTVKSIFENNKHYSLKFIEKTKSLNEKRGIQPEDGIIRIKFRFYDQNYGKITTTNWPNWSTPEPYWYSNPTYNNGSYFRPRRLQKSLSGSDQNISYSASYSINSNSFNNPASEVFSKATINCSLQVQEDLGGITIKGDTRNDVSYSSVDINPLSVEDTEHVMLFRLQGNFFSDEPLVKPVYSKAKKTCDICGTKSPITNNFCPECGNCLK